MYNSLPEKPRLCRKIWPRRLRSFLTLFENHKHNGHENQDVQSWFYCSWGLFELLVEGSFGTWTSSWSDGDFWEGEVVFQSTEVTSIVRYFQHLQHRFKPWYSSLGAKRKAFLFGLECWVRLWNNHYLMCLFTLSGFRKKCSKQKFENTEWEKSKVLTVQQ